MTAVEFLEEKLLELFENHLPFELLEEAKEMEKQQIIDFGNDLLAQNNVNYIAVPDLAEQYYNETFKNK
jgi:hypothetical protein